MSSRRSENGQEEKDEFEVIRDGKNRVFLIESRVIIPCS